MEALRAGSLSSTGDIFFLFFFYDDDGGAKRKRQRPGMSTTNVGASISYSPLHVAVG